MLPRMRRLIRRARGRRTASLVGDRFLSHATTTNVDARAGMLKANLEAPLCLFSYPMTTSAA